MFSDRDEAIVAVLQGVSVDVVAEELGVSTDTVYRWMRDGGYSTQAKKLRDREIVNVYVDSDTRVHDICDQFGISIATLYGILHKHKTPMRKPTTTEEDMDAVVEMYEAGHTLKRIRLDTGKSYSTIYEILEQRNIRTRYYSRRRGA